MRTAFESLFIVLVAVLGLCPIVVAVIDFFAWFLWGDALIRVWEPLGVFVTVAWSVVGVPIGLAALSVLFEPA